MGNTVFLVCFFFQLLFLDGFQGLQTTTTTGISSATPAPNTTTETTTMATNLTPITDLEINIMTAQTSASNELTTETEETSTMMSTVNIMQPSGSCFLPFALCCPGRNDSCNRSCFCDEICLQLSDCCEDYNATCISGLHTEVTTTWISSAAPGHKTEPITMTTDIIPTTNQKINTVTATQTSGSDDLTTETEENSTMMSTVKTIQYNSMTTITASEPQKMTPTHTLFETPQEGRQTIVTITRISSATPAWNNTTESTTMTSDIISTTNPKFNIVTATQTSGPDRLTTSTGENSANASTVKSIQTSSMTIINSSESQKMTTTHTLVKTPQQESENVKNLMVGNITITSVDLAWEAPKGNLSTYIVEVFGDTVFNKNVTSESVTIGSLLPGRQYTFTIYVLTTNNVKSSGTKIVATTYDRNLLFSVRFSTSLNKEERQQLIMSKVTKILNMQIPSKNMTAVWKTEERLF